MAGVPRAASDRRRWFAVASTFVHEPASARSDPPGTLCVVDSRDVTREIRRLVWPQLREAGFDSFTGRTAWRYVGSNVDVLNFQSFSASLADGVGCTPYSFALNLGVWVPGELEARVLKPDAHGRPRPAEWECSRRTHLTKSIRQPWFEPFSSKGSRGWPLGLRKHREGLKHVIRRDRHDREGIWFVLSDGSNLVGMVEDALAAIVNIGLAWFEAARQEAVAEHDAKVRDGLI